jgi:hypothetical protein
MTPFCVDSEWIVGGPKKILSGKKTSLGDLQIHRFRPKPIVAANQRIVGGFNRTLAASKRYVDHLKTIVFKRHRRIC